VLYRGARAPCLLFLTREEAPSQRGGFRLPFVAAGTTGSCTSHLYFICKKALPNWGFAGGDGLAEATLVSAGHGGHIQLVSVGTEVFAAGDVPWGECPASLGRSGAPTCTPELCTVSPAHQWDELSQCSSTVGGESPRTRPPVLSWVGTHLGTTLG